MFYLEEKKHATKPNSIIDWKYTDVWKYLIENNFKYNKVYDKMYMLGGTEDVSGFFGPRKGFRCLYGLARIRA
jgi:3'-phosphoadenosine 5'-phosphosulfate sulfotransferase (PAPS reductase)/FAD synthetase